MWVKEGKRWLNDKNGAYIVKDNIIGWLVYESEDVFCRPCADYKSFDRLKDAKKYGEDL